MDLIAPKKTETELASEAAKRTADALRRTALNPQIAKQDVPVMLIIALGWEEYARQLVADAEPVLVRVN